MSLFIKMPLTACTRIQAHLWLKSSRYLIISHNTKSRLRGPQLFLLLGDVKGRQHLSNSLSFSLLVSGQLQLLQAPGPDLVALSWAWESLCTWTSSPLCSAALTRLRPDAPAGVGLFTLPWRPSDGQVSTSWRRRWDAGSECAWS